MKIDQLALSYVDNHLEEIYAYFAKIIGFDTTNYISHGNEKECQNFIFQTFKELGAEVEIYSAADFPEIYQHPDFEQGRGMENRPNVTIHIPCAEPYKPTAKKIMLSHHTDTMPAGELSQWKNDPFTLTIQDGKAYGLGVSDDKYGAAVSYAIVKAIQENHLLLKHDLYLTAVSDEEYFGGNGSLLACLKYPCDLYINLDGCDYETQIAGLGGTCFELNVSCGFETSSAEPVVEALAFSCQELKPFGQRRFAELEANPLYTGSEHAKSAYRVMEFGCGSFGTDVDTGKMRIVVYSTLSRKELKNELDAIYQERIAPYFQEHGIISQGFQQIVRCMEYQETKDPSDAYKLSNIMSSLSGRSLQTRGACLSDLDIYLRNGSGNSFNVGLIREFKLEGGAHKPNEFVFCEEFENLTKALLLFVLDWCEAFIPSNLKEDTINE